MACCSKKVKDALKTLGNKVTDNKEAQLQALEKVQHLLIDARVDWIECTVICQTENKYTMQETGPDYAVAYQDQNKGFATFEEKSDCICRICVRHAREFKGTFKIHGIPLATVESKYKCHSWNPCCSCPMSYPELFIKQGDQLIGVIQIPYYTCGCGKKGHPCSIMEMNVFDANQRPLYRISGNCCQTSVWCLPFMCCGCETIQYDIREWDTPEKQMQSPQQGMPRDTLSVGTIKNVCRDCPEEFFTNADKFGVNFPPNADGQKRLLLIMAAIYLDYSQYE